MTDIIDMTTNRSLEPEAMKYITYMPINNDPETGKQTISQDTSLEIWFEQLGRLTNFFNFKLIAKPIKRNYIAKVDRWNYGISRLIEHKLIYIERLIWDLRDEKHNKSIKLMKEVIEYLKTNVPDSKLIDNQKIIYLNDSQLFSDIKEEPSKCTSLTSLYNRLTQKITLLSPPILNINTSKLELTSIILDLAGKVDPTTSFFPMSMIQTTFDKLIMSDIFPWKETLSSMIQSFNEIQPQDFIDSLFNVASQITEYLNITKEYSDSTLSFLLYRFIFDEIYPLKFAIPDENNKNVSQTKFQILHKEIKNSDLGLQLEFCPPLDLNKTPSETFKNDNEFGKAVDLFDTILFQTNPLDMLAVVVQTIEQIEKSASFYESGKTLVFPFEVIFSLFNAVVLSSSVDDLSLLAQFIDDYTPLSGLCPSFDYAKANIIASATEIQRLMEDHID